MPRRTLLWSFFPPGFHAMSMPNPALKRPEPNNAWQLGELGGFAPFRAGNFYASPAEYARGYGFTNTATLYKKCVCGCGEQNAPPSFVPEPNRALDAYEQTYHPCDRGQSCGDCFTSPCPRSA